MDLIYNKGEERMIINELKPCCNECGDIDGYFDTEKLQYTTGEKKAISKICCEHQAVCKKYIEYEVKTE